MDSIEEVQEYIDSNGFLSPVEFKRNNYLLYSLCQRRGWLRLLVYKRRRIDWSDYDSVEKVAKFIKDNGIRSRIEFQDNYSSLYNRALHSGYMKELVFEDDVLRENWKEYNSIEKAQKFIDDNNIESPAVIKKEFPGLYWVISRKNKWLDKLVFPNRKLSWDNIDTIEKLQEFIDSNSEIHTPADLREMFGGLYSKALRYGWAKDLKYEHRQMNYSEYTLEQVQSIVDSEGIGCSTELLSIDRSLYCACQHRGWLSELKFPKKNRSFMEMYFDRLFPEDQFPTFIRNQKQFDWLISSITGKRMHLDIFIPEISLAIEFQGSQHFYIDDGQWFDGMTLEDQIERDTTKYRLVKEKGYDIIYFVDIDKYPDIPKRVPDKFEPGGYMGTTIMTSWDELKTTILSKLGLK